MVSVNTFVIEGIAVKALLMHSTSTKLGSHSSAETVPTSSINATATTMIMQG